MKNLYHGAYLPSTLKQIECGAKFKKEKLTETHIRVTDEICSKIQWYEQCDSIYPSFYDTVLIILEKYYPKDHIIDYQI